jgi:hypothetical protein
MKNIKFAISVFALIYCVSVSSGFTNGENSKIITVAMYYFNGAHKNISQLLQNEITDPRNWSTSGSRILGATNILAGIDFEVKGSKGSENDGVLTLQKAIEALWSYYDQDSHSFPSSSFPVKANNGTSTIVNIYKWG